MADDVDALMRCVDRQPMEDLDDDHTILPRLVRPSDTSNPVNSASKLDMIDAE